MKTYGYSTHGSVDAERRSGRKYKSDNKEGKGRVHDGVLLLDEVWNRWLFERDGCVDWRGPQATEATGFLLCLLVV